VRTREDAAVRHPTWSADSFLDLVIEVQGILIEGDVGTQLAKALIVRRDTAHQPLRLPTARGDRHMKID
jgi:hypothetical protein